MKLEIEIGIIKVDLRRVAGIYFLLWGDEVVYVGQSRNIHGRVANHFAVGEKDFDRYGLIEYGGAARDEELNEAEAHYIVKYLPKYNKSLPENEAWKSVHSLAVDVGITPFRFKKKARAFGINAFLVGDREYMEASGDLHRLIRRIEGGEV